MNSSRKCYAKSTNGNFVLHQRFNLTLFSLIYIRKVGTAAIQVCKSVGVDVIATAGSDDGVQMLKSMGVTKIYNHHSENYIKEIKESGAKIDVILEMLANKNLVKDLDIISSQGRIVVSKQNFILKIQHTTRHYCYCAQHVILLVSV